MHDGQGEAGFAVSQIVKHPLQRYGFISDLLLGVTPNIDGQQIVGRAKLYPMALV